MAATGVRKEDVGAPPLAGVRSPRVRLRPPPQTHLTGPRSASGEQALRRAGPRAVLGLRRPRSRASLSTDARSPQPRTLSRRRSAIALALGCGRMRARVLGSTMRRVLLWRGSRTAVRSRSTAAVDRTGNQPRWGATFPAQAHVVAWVRESAWGALWAEPISLLGQSVFSVGLEFQYSAG
ncbi:hypothetical protein GUJ93_ZPchr0015g6745 [Zizania palustris]|uniref:Uncharacterized protein n=1 Tax=Zizania palustris TaxID=103762 RepID=A0A8J5VVF6_ZIZPA|nr:hypothetical protein GUJ93_ZPchr0015g6745 [Zizania palustris]